MTDQIQTPLSDVNPIEKVIEITDESMYQIEDYLKGDSDIYVVGQDVLVIPQDGSERLRFVDVVDRLVSEELLLVDSEGNAIIDANLLDPGEGAVEVLSDGNGLGLSVSGLGIGDGLGYSGLLGYGDMGLGGAGIAAPTRVANNYGDPVNFVEDVFTYKLVSIGQPYGSASARARSVSPGKGENGEVYENQEFSLKIEGIADALNSVAPSGSPVFLNLYLKPTSDASAADFNFETLQAGSVLPMEGVGLAWLHSYNPDTGVIIIQTLGWEDGSATYVNLWTSADSLVEVNENFEFGLEINEQMTGEIIDDGAANLIAMESQTGTVIDQPYIDPWEPGAPVDPADPTDPGNPGNPSDPVDPTNPLTGSAIGFALRPMDAATKDQYDYQDADGNLRYPGLQVEEGSNLVLSIATSGATLGSDPIYLELNMYVDGGLVLGGDFDKTTPDASIDDIDWAGITSNIPGVEIYADGNGKIIVKVPEGFEAGTDIELIIPTLEDDIVESLEDIRFDLTEEVFSGSINDVISGNTISVTTNSDLEDNVVFQVEEDGKILNNTHAEGQIADKVSDPEGPTDPDKPGVDGEALNVWLEPITADHKTLENVASEDGSRNAEFGIRMDGTLAENATLGLSLVLRPSEVHDHQTSVDDFDLTGLAITLSDGTALKLVPQAQYDSSVHDGYYFVDGDNIQINFTVSGAAAEEIIVSVPAQHDNEIEPAEYFEADLSHWQEGSDSGLKSQDGSVIVKDDDATGVIVDHWDPDQLDTYDYEIDVDPSEVKESNEVTITVTGKGTDNDGDGTHASAPDDIPIYIDVSLSDPISGNGFATPDDFDWSNINEGDQLDVFDENGNIVDDATAWVQSVDPETGEITIGTQGWDHDNHVDLTLIAKDDNKIEQDEDFTVNVDINTELTDDALDGIDKDGKETDDPVRVTADDDANGTVIDDGDSVNPTEGDKIEFTLNPLDPAYDVHDNYDGVQIEENEKDQTDNVIILSVSSQGLDPRGNEVDDMELGSSVYLLLEMVDPANTSGRADTDDINWKDASITDADGNPIDGAEIYADGNGKIVVELPIGFEAGKDFQVHLPTAHDGVIEGLEHFEFELVETIDMPSFNDVISGGTFDGKNDDSLKDNISWADENDIAEGDIIDEVVDPITPPDPKEPDADQLVFELQPSSADDNIASEFKDENRDAIFKIKLNDGDNDYTPDEVSYGDLSANASVGLTLVLKPSEDQKYTANMEKDIDLDNITLAMVDKAGAKQGTLTITSKEDYDADPSAYDGYYFFNDDGHLQLNFIVSDMVKGWTIDVHVPAIQDNVVEVDEYFEADLYHWDEGSSEGLRAADNGVKAINNDAKAKIVDATNEGGTDNDDSYKYEIIEAGPKDDPSANEIDEGDSLVIVIEGKGTDNDGDDVHSDGPEDIPVYIDVDIKDVAGGANPDDFDFSGLKPGDPIVVTDENGKPVEDDAKAWIESVDPDTGVITVGTENWDHTDRIELEIPVVDEVTLPGEEEGDEDYEIGLDINKDLTDDEIDGGDSGDNPRVEVEGDDATGVIKDKPEDHLSFSLLPLSSATDDEREGILGYEGVQVEEGSEVTLAIASSGVELSEGPAYLEINLESGGKATPADFDWSDVSASYNGTDFTVYADGNGKLIVEVPEGFTPEDGSNIEITFGVAEDGQIEGLEDFTFTLEEEPFTGDITYVNGGGGQASLKTNDNAGVTAKDSSAEGAIVDKVTDPLDPSVVDPKNPVDPDEPLDNKDPDGKDNLALRVELEAVAADHLTGTNIAAEVADKDGDKAQASFFIGFTDGDLAEGTTLGLSLVLSPVYEKTDEKGNLLQGKHAAEVEQDIDYQNITLVLILKDGTVKQITGNDLVININDDGNIQIDFKVSGVPEGSRIRVNVPAMEDEEIEVAEYFEAELSHWSEGSDLGLKAVDGAVDVINNDATGVIVDAKDDGTGGGGSGGGNDKEDSYEFEIIEVGVDSDPNTPVIEINEGDNLVVTIEGKGTDNDNDGEHASSPSDVPIYIDVSIEDVTGGANPDDFDFSGFKPDDPIVVKDKDGNPVDSDAWIESVDPDTGTITVGVKDWDHENRIDLEIPVLKDGEIEGPEDGKVTIDINDELTDDGLDGSEDGGDPRVEAEDEADFEIIDGSDKETIDFVLRSIVDTDTHYYDGTQIEETKDIIIYVGTSAHKNITETEQDIFLEINMIDPSSQDGKADLDDIDWTGVTASFNGSPLNIYATADGKLVLEIPAGFNPRLGPALGEDIKINLPTLDNDNGVVEGLEEFIFEMVETPFSGDIDYVNNGGGNISVATEQEIADKVDYTLTDNGDLDPARGTTNEQAIGEIIDIVTDPVGPEPPTTTDPEGEDGKALRIELEAISGDDNLAYEAVDGNKTDADSASFTIKLSSDSDGPLASNATLGLRLTLRPIKEKDADGNGFADRHAAEMGTSAADSDLDVAGIKIILADGTELGSDDYVLKFINVNGEDRIQIDFKLTGGIKEGQSVKVYVPARQDGEIEAAEYFEVDIAHWPEGSDDGLVTDDQSVVVKDAVAEGKIVDHENEDKLDEFDYVVDSLTPSEVEEGNDITVVIKGDGKDNDGDGIANAPDDIPVYVDVDFVGDNDDVDPDDFDWSHLNPGDELVVYDKDGKPNDDAKAWIEDIVKDPDTGEPTGEVIIGTEGWDDDDYVNLTLKPKDDGILENDEDFTVTTDINTELTDDAIDGIDKDGNPVDANEDGVIDDNDQRVGGDETGEEGKIIEKDAGIKFGLSLDDTTVDASSHYEGTQVEERPENFDPAGANAGDYNIVLNLSSTVNAASAGIKADVPVYLVINMDTASSDLNLGSSYSNENDASLDDIDWSAITVEGVPNAKVYADATTGTIVVELPAGYEFGGSDLKINVPVKYDTEAEGLEDFQFELQDSLDNIPSFNDAITGNNFSGSNSLGGIGFKDEEDRQAGGQIIDNDDGAGLKLELVAVDADADDNIAYEQGDGVDDDAVFEIKLADDTEYTLADNADLGLSLTLKPSGDIYAAEMSDIDMAGITILFADGSAANLVSESDYNAVAHDGYYFMNADGHIQINFTIKGGLDKGETITIKVPAVHDNEIEPAEYFEADLAHWDDGSDNGLKAQDGTVNVDDADATGKIIDNEDESKLDVFDYQLTSVSPDKTTEGNEFTVEIQGVGTDKDGDGTKASAPSDIPVYLDVKLVAKAGNEAVAADFDLSAYASASETSPIELTVTGGGQAWVVGVDASTGTITIKTIGWNDGSKITDLKLKAAEDSLLESDEDFTVETEINTTLTDNALDGDDGKPSRVDATGEGDGTIIDDSSGIEFNLVLDSSTVDASNHYGGTQVEEKTNIVLNLSSEIDTSLIAAGTTANDPVYLVIKMDTASSDLNLGGSYSNENDADLADIDWSGITISGITGAKIYADGNGTLVIELPAGYQFDGGDDLLINIPAKDDSLAEGLEDFQFELQDYSKDDIAGFTNVITGGDDFTGGAKNSLGGIGVGDKQAGGQIIDNDDGAGLKLELVAVDADADDNIAYEQGDGVDDDAVFEIKLADDTEYTLADNADLGLSLTLKPSGDIYAAEMSDIDKAGITILFADGSAANLVSESAYNAAAHDGYYFMNADGHIQINFTVKGGLDKGETITIKVPAVHDNEIEPAEYFEADLAHWDDGSDNGLKAQDGTVNVDDADATGKIIDNEDESKLDVFDYQLTSVSPDKTTEGNEFTVEIQGVGTDKDGDGIKASAPSDIPVYLDVKLVAKAGNEVVAADFDLSAYASASEASPIELTVTGGGQAWVVGVDASTGTITIKTIGWNDGSKITDLKLKAAEDSLLESDEDFTVETEINTTLTDNALDGDDGKPSRVDATGEGDGTIIDDSSGIEFNLKLDSSTVDASNHYGGTQVEEKTNIVLNLSSEIDTSLIAAGTTANDPVYLVIKMDTASSDLNLGGSYSNENDADLADIDWSGITISGITGAKIYADGNGTLVIELPAGYQFDGGDDLLINIPAKDDSLAEGLEDFQFELQDYSKDDIAGFTNIITGGDDFTGGAKNSLGGIGVGDKQAGGQIIDNNDDAGLHLTLETVDGDSNVAKEGNTTDNMSEFTIKLASDSKYTLADGAELGLSLTIKPITEVDANSDGNIDRWSAEMGTNKDDSDIDVENIIITLANGTALKLVSQAQYDSSVHDGYYFFDGGNIQINFTVKGGLGDTDKITVKIPAREDYELEAQEYFEVDLAHWDGGSDNGLKAQDGTVKVTAPDDRGEEATGKIVDADESLMFQFEVTEATAVDDDANTTNKVEVKEGTDFKFEITGQSVDKDGNVLSQAHDAPEDIPIYIKVSLKELGLSNDAEAGDFDWSSVSIEYNGPGGGSASIDGFDEANGVIIIKTQGWDHGDTATITLPVHKETNETAIEGNEDFVLTPEIDGKTDDGFENRVDISGDASKDGIDSDGNITGEILDVSDATFNLAFKSLGDVLVGGSSQDQRQYGQSAFYGGVDIEESENANDPSSVILGIDATGVAINKDVYVKLSLVNSSQSGSASVDDFDWTSVKLDNMPSGFAIYANANGEMILKVPAGFDPTTSGTEIRISIDIKSDDVVENREQFMFEMESQYDGTFSYVNNGSGGSLTTGDQLESNYLDLNTAKKADGYIMDKVTDGHTPTPSDKHESVDPNNPAGDDGLALYIKMEDVADTDAHIAQYDIALTNQSAGDLADNAALGLSLIVRGISGFDLGSSTTDSAIDLSKIKIIINGTPLDLISGNSANTSTGAINSSYQGQYYFVEDGVLRVDFKVLESWKVGDNIEVQLPLKDGSVIAADNLQVSLEHWSQGSYDVTGAGDNGGLWASDDAVVIEQDSAPTGGTRTTFDGIKEFENQTIHGRELGNGAMVSSGNQTFGIYDSDLDDASSGEVVVVSSVTVNTSGLPSFITASQSVNSDGEGVIYGKYGMLTISDGKKEASTSGDNDMGEYSYKLYTEADRSTVKTALSITDAQFDELLAAIEALDEGDKVQDEFTYTLKDKAGGTGKGEIVVNIDGENDAPILTGTSGFTKDNVSAYAGSSASETVKVIPDGSTLTISDADDDKITKLEVTLMAAAGTALTGDKLAHTLSSLPSGITLDTVNSTDTKLIFVASSGASFADFLSIIHAITYQNTDPSSMDRSSGRQVKFQIFDDNETSEDSSSSFAGQFGSDGKVTEPNDHNAHQNADSVWIQDITFQGAPSSEGGGFSGSVIEFKNQTILKDRDFDGVMPDFDTDEEIKQTQLTGSLKINDPDGDTVKISAINRTSQTFTYDTFYGFSNWQVTEDSLPDMADTFNMNDLSGKIYGYYGILEFNETANSFNTSNPEANFSYRLYTMADVDAFITACGGDPANKYGPDESLVGRQAYKTFITILSTIEGLQSGGASIEEVFNYTLEDSTGLTNGGTEAITIEVKPDNDPDDFDDVFADGDHVTVGSGQFAGGEATGDFKMIDQGVEFYQQVVTVKTVDLFAPVAPGASYDESDLIRDGSDNVIDAVIIRDGSTTITLNEILNLNSNHSGVEYRRVSYDVRSQNYVFGEVQLTSGNGTGTVYGVFGKLVITDGYYDIHDIAGTGTVGSQTGQYGTGSYIYTLYSNDDRGELITKFKAAGSTDTEAAAKVDALLDYIASGQAATDGAEDWFRIGMMDDRETGSAHGTITVDIPDAPSPAPSPAPTPPEARSVSISDNDSETIMGTDNNDSLTVSTAGLYEINGREGDDLLKLIGASDALVFDTQKKDQTIQTTINGESVEINIYNVEKIEFEETTYEWTGREWIIES